MSEKFIRAEEVAEVMEISVAYAYKIIRKLNQELSDKGFMQESCIIFTLCSTAIPEATRAERSRSATTRITLSLLNLNRIPMILPRTSFSISLLMAIRKQQCVMSEVIAETSLFMI